MADNFEYTCPSAARRITHWLYLHAIRGVEAEMVVKKSYKKNADR